MTISPLHAPQTGAASDAGNSAPGALNTTVQHLMGTLWDEVLTEMNKTGMDDASLGPGGGDFQSMFLWNIAQNDFGKYDSSLAQATIAQIGGHNAGALAAAQEVSAPDFSAIPANQAMTNDAPASIAMEGNAASAPAANVTLAAATEFARKLWPQLNQAAQKLGIPAIGLLAQAALETGWGTAAPGNNLFGVKAAGGQGGSVLPTEEMQDGVMVPARAAFRDYSSPAASIDDYVGQIMTGFQDVVGQGSVAGFARALQSGGYATDDHYAAKIIGIAQSPMMSGVLQALGASQTTAPASAAAPTP